MPRKMKESGVEWLGVVPCDWEVERLQWHLEEVVEKNDPIRTTNILSLTNDRGVIPYEEKGDIGNKAKENFAEYKLAFKDTIVANSMNILIGSVGLSKYDGCVSPVYYVFKNRPNSSIRFFNYVFQMPAFQRELRRYANGILEIRLRVSASDILRRQVAVPSPPEQERIAAFLDERCAKIDVMIAEAKASIEDYKKWKQSIIFEAVTGKHEKNLKPSGVDWIGDVPEGWKVCNASRVIHSTQNGLTRRDLVDSSGEIVLRLKNINPFGIVDYSSVVRMRLTEAERSRYALREGDLLFARVNGSRDLVGKCAVFCTQSEIVAYNDHLIRVRLNDCMDVKYFTYYLTSSAGRTEIDKYVITAAGQCTISGEGLRLVKVVLPTYENQRRIAEVLDEKCAAIDKQVGEKEALIADLEAYKKSLIFETVTGKREVA